jgi:2'-hydroxyisoflavone reductase
MKIRVLGRTVFLSRAVALRGRERGHDMTCAARGVSGKPPVGVRFVRIDRATVDGLSPLAGERYDAVIDVARQSVTQVRAAVDVLGLRAGQWTYVSTRSVYAEKVVPGQTSSAPLVEPGTSDLDEEDPANYGRLKVAAEQALLGAVGSKVFIPRPGLVVGRGDVSDRYGYWPARMNRGGQVLCPGDSAILVRWIDVLDLPTGSSSRPRRC